jgi:hypothetical protein
MSISWTDTLAIRDAKGKTVSISTSPRTGQNSKLVAVGKSYGVQKLIKDPPHWSSDGSFR